MDAPLLLSLAHRRLRTHGALPLEGAFAGGRALGLAWRREGWVLILQPRPELWLLPLAHPAWKRLEQEAGKEAARTWGAWLKGARLSAVEGDPRERWLGLGFQRRAITGRLESLRLAFQAIPGRAGIRLDIEGARLGLGAPFPATAPSPEGEPPPFLRWAERFGPRLEEAVAGLLDEVMEGTGDLEERHRAWSLQRAEALVLAPLEAAARRAREAEGRRLERLAADLARDRAKHKGQLPLKAQAAALSGELYRLKGATGEVELLEGRRLILPEGLSAEMAAQRWFQQAKKAERGLARVAELERELAQERAAFEGGAVVPPPKPSREEKKRGKAGTGSPRPGRGGVGVCAQRGTPIHGKRSDGKGQAFRSVKVEGFEVLIGKGDAENDQLTFKVADNLDLWLHVANLPGSHVVIRNPDKLSDLPREVIERAAQLAAFHSKARDAGKVEVHVARIADISKPKGFAPGKVILKKWSSVRVYPKG